MKKHKKRKISQTDDPIFEEVKRFYEFMNSNKLSTLEFSKEDLYIKMVRKGSQPQVQTSLVPVFAPGDSDKANASQASSAASSGAPSSPTQTKVAGKTIKAPMSGIFYRAPSPSSPPYVREGDHVKKGQILCIIEAMKVFNEIKCERDCQIIQVLVENGKPIQINQDVFLVKEK